MSLRVMHVEGETTRFYVESNSLECLQCKRKFNRRLRPELRVGGPCPARKCATGTLDLFFHLVDIASYNGNGECACEWFQFELTKRLKITPPQHRALGHNRCSHIEAARQFALDVAVKIHERERLVNANGQTEDQT